jgi:hypothetical protein
METYEVERIKRLEDAEEKAYTSRQNAEDLVGAIIGKLVFQGETYNPKIFFELRVAFQEYESAEEHCTATTDRLNEYHKELASI